MQTSPETKAIVPALIKALAEMENVKRTKENPFFKSTYADLAQVLEMTRPILSKHGLVAVQFAEKVFEDPREKITVTTRIYHDSNEWIQSETNGYAVTKTPQEFGSIVTYLRRYALTALLGIASEDDDANMGSTTEETQTKGKAGQKRELSMAEKMDALPQDLKDLLYKAGCNTLAQRYHLYKSVNGDLEAMRKEARKAIAEKAQN